MISELLCRNNVLQNIHLEITDSCNLACKHCYITDRTIKMFKDTILPFEDIKNVILQAKSLGVITVTLTGGEPLLHPKVLDIIEYISSNNIALKLMTNGILINENNIHQIKKYVNHIYLTQYGYDDDSYDNTVGIKGMYSVFKHSIQLLDEHKISYDINYTMTRNNCGNMKYIIDNFNSIETHISYQKENPYSKKYQLTYESLKCYYSMLDKAEPYSNKSTKLCNICESSIVIKSNGKVIPCPSFDHYIGDINHDSLMTIWNSEKIKEIRTYSKFENFSMCQKCRYSEYSYNVCIANNYNETGELFKCSDTTCSICKILHERSMTDDQQTDKK